MSLKRFRTTGPMYLDYVKMNYDDKYLLYCSICSMQMVNKELKEFLDV